jgi:hypothetical protein
MVGAICAFQNCGNSLNWNTGQGFFFFFERKQTKCARNIYEWQTKKKYNNIALQAKDTMRQRCTFAAVCRLAFAPKAC